ncbi:MAG: tetratricopeptide repeat protein [Nitrospirae bacterium]|nr:tetratricopeptide repeat protein [Nitrospirota bacterium]
MKDNDMAAKKVETLQTKISQTPSTGLFYLLSEEYLRLGMFDEAEILCKQGIERHPDYICAHILLGKIYMAKREYKEAIKAFEAVIKLMPSNLYAYKKLTEIYASLGQKDKAIDLYLKALSSGTEKSKVSKRSRVFLPKSEMLKKEIKPCDFEKPSENEDLFKFILESLGQPFDNERFTDDGFLTNFQDINEELTTQNLQSSYKISETNQSTEVNCKENTKLKKLDNMLLSLKRRQQQFCLS